MGAHHPLPALTDVSVAPPKIPLLTNRLYNLLLLESF